MSGYSYRLEKETGTKWIKVKGLMTFLQSQKAWVNAKKTLPNGIRIRMLLISGGGASTVEAVQTIKK